MKNALTIYTPNPNNMVIREDNHKIYTTEYLIAKYRLNRDLEVGKTYTVTFFGEKNPTANVFGLWLNSAKDRVGTFIRHATYPHCWSVTFTISPNFTFTREEHKRLISIYNVPSNNKIDATIENICMVEGSEIQTELFMGGIEIDDYTMQVPRMGIPTLSASIMYPFCLDTYWTGKEYVDVNNHRFFIGRIPTSSKDNDDERFMHDITFNSEHEILSEIYYFDVVTQDSVSEYKPITNSTDVLFYGTLREFIGRLNANFQQSKIGDSILETKVDLIEGDDTPYGDGYCALLSTNGEYDLDVEKEISFEDKTLWEAISEIYNIFKVPFTFNGKQIIFGNKIPTVDAVFKYGVEDELLAITKADSNNKIITEITGIGGTDNIPYYYPNKTPYGDVYLVTKNGLLDSNVKIANLTRLLASLPKEEPITYTQTSLADAEFLHLEVYDRNYPDVEPVSIPLNQSTWITLRRIYGDDNANMSQILGNNKYDARNHGGMGFSAFDMRIRIQVNQIGKFKFDISSFVYGVSPLEGVYQTKYPTYFVSGRNYWPISISQVTYWDEADSRRGRLEPTIEMGDEGMIVNCKATGIIDICLTTYLYKRIEKNTPEEEKRVVLTVSEVTLDDGIERYSYGWQLNKQFYQLKEFGLALDGISQSDVPVGAQIMWSARNRMPYLGYLTIPIYIQTNGDERFLKAFNKQYLLKDSSTDYYSFPNEYNPQHPLQHIHRDEDIKPTIENIKNANGQLLGEIVDIAYDDNDNDSLTEIGEDSNEYQHSFFYLKLHIYNGDYGFDLFKSASETDAMTLQMISGNCNGCKFPIQATSFEDSEDGLQYNPVQVVDNVLAFENTVFDDFTASTNIANVTKSISTAKIGNLKAGDSVYIDFDYEHDLSFGNTANGAVRLNIGNGLQNLTISDAITASMPNKGHMRRLMKMPSGITEDMSSTPFMRFDYVNGGSFTIRNLSIVNANSQIVSGDYDDKIDLDNLQYAQQNTQINSIWICVRKDTDTFGVIMPNREHNYFPQRGDKFNIININLPEVYLRDAEKRLMYSALDKMAANNTQRFNFSIDLSRIWVEQNHSVANQITEESKIIVRYDGVDYEQYVSAITYEYSKDSILPAIKVDLEDELTVTSSFVDRVASNAIAMLPNVANQPTSTPAQTQGIDIRSFYKDLDQRYIRRDIDDVTAGAISSAKGFQIAPYLAGISGGFFGLTANGETYLETDIMKVRKSAYFEKLNIVHTEAIGGKEIITPGGGLVITFVESFINSTDNNASYFKCHYKSQDNNGNKVRCRLVAGDFVICQNFNAQEGVNNNISNKFYWRQVVEVTTDYVMLTNRNSSYIDSNPEAGDAIVHLGNVSDVMRQSAIVLSTVDNNAPSQFFFSGINRTSLDGCNVIEMGVDNETGEPFLHVYGEAYIGAKDGSTYVKFTPEDGLEVKGRITASSTIGDSSIEEYINDNVSIPENLNLIGNSGYFNSLSGWDVVSDHPKIGQSIINDDEHGDVIRLSRVGTQGNYVRLNTALNSNGGNLYSKILASQTYVFSFYAKANTTTTATFNFRKTTDSSFTLLLPQELVTLTTQWKRFTFKFISATELPDDGCLSIHFNITSTVRTINITKISLIEGDKVMPWVESANGIVNRLESQVKTFTGDNLPNPPYNINDIWFKTNDGVSGAMLRCVVAKKFNEQAAISDWADATDYDNTKTVIDGGVVTSGTVQLAGVITDEQGNVTSQGAIKTGITGDGVSEDSVRIWAGSTKSLNNTAPFRVLQDGSVYATKANISGHLTAQSISLIPQTEDGLVNSALLLDIYRKGDIRHQHSHVLPALQDDEIRSIELLYTADILPVGYEQESILTGADSTVMIGYANWGLDQYREILSISAKNNSPLGLYKLLGFGFNGNTYWVVSHMENI